MIEFDGLPGIPAGTPLPSITGGDAKSGVGDSVFSTEFRNNGLNYKPGVPAWMIAAGVAAAGLGLAFLKSGSKK